MKSVIRAEIEIFFTTLAFFTRIPKPAWVTWSPERLNQSVRYLPLVGWVVGAVAAFSYLGFATVLPLSISVILSMILTTGLTGAFHEDGLADTCDGLGGGMSKEKVLMIMKDSRVGSFGAIGMALMLMAKAAALIELGFMGGAILVSAMLVAHPLSRLASISLIQILPYVREDESAKSKLLARRLTLRELLIACTFGLLPLALLSPAAIIFSLMTVSAITALAAWIFARRLGGYTGDLLGAAQQLTELACYLGILVASRAAVIKAL
ncbi:MAG: adenosylcobinamide-GDP ribazoletransferase [Syntrophales bacterium]|nr:adenosylcobinamide-GDP ribazoletransferase [Syntrophales bacterium]